MSIEDYTLCTFGFIRLYAQQSFFNAIRAGVGKDTFIEFCFVATRFPIKHPEFDKRVEYSSSLFLLVYSFSVSHGTTTIYYVPSYSDDRREQERSG